MSAKWMDAWYHIIQDSAEQMIQRPLTIQEVQALRQITSGMLLEVWERDLERVTSATEGEAWIAALVSEFGPAMES